MSKSARNSDLPSPPMPAGVTKTIDGGDLVNMIYLTNRRLPVQKAFGRGRQGPLLGLRAQSRSGERGADHPPWEAGRRSRTRGGAGGAGTASSRRTRGGAREPRGRLERIGGSRQDPFRLAPDGTQAAGKAELKPRCRFSLTPTRSRRSSSEDPRLFICAGSPAFHAPNSSRAPWSSESSTKGPSDHSIVNGIFRTSILASSRP